MPINDNAQSEYKTKELMFEYGELRKEILNNFTLGIQTLGGTVTFVAVIMTLGFSQAIQSYLAKAALFLVGEAIALIGLNQTMNIANSTFQIASYLRVFNEPELEDVKWETRLHLFRANLTDVPYEEHTSSVRYTYAFMIIVNYVLASACALLHSVSTVEIRGIGDALMFFRSILWVAPLTVSLIVITLVATLYLLRVSWRHYRIFVIEEDRTYTSVWKRIRSDELETKSSEPTKLDNK